MRITITGVDEVKLRLTDVADIEWDEIWRKQGEEMIRKSDAIVPVDTGALRDSAYYEDGEFGYTVDYASHVNYGHATRSGGFVPGRHFLEEVVNDQEEKYRQAVLNNLREGKW